MLATRSDLFVPTTVDAHFHVLVCRQVLFSLDILLCLCLTLSLTFYWNLKMFFPAEIPLELPPLRGIEHPIDLILRATMINCVAYRTNPEETKEI
jgi:hypothetical protein